MIKNTRTKIIRYRLKKYEISIDNLDKNSIIQFKEKIKFLNDSSQKSKKVYKIWNIVVTAVIDAKADYVIALKSNHPLFNDKLNLYFDDKRLNTAYSINSEKVNSSIITYEYFQKEDIKWYADYKSWNKIHSFGLIRKTIIKNGKTSIEKRFYISSLFLDISLFSRAIRNHWNVENKLH